MTAMNEELRGICAPHTRCGQVTHAAVGKRARQRSEVKVQAITTKSCKLSKHSNGSGARKVHKK